MDCAFCDIVSNREGQIVDEDEQTLAFMDINPATRGHVLVVPKTHRRDIWELDEVEAKAVMATAWRIAKVIRVALEPDGLNLVQANGGAAFQDVFHFHLHVIPRYVGDKVVKAWDSAPGSPEEIRQTAEAISAGS